MTCAASVTSLLPGYPTRESEVCSRDESIVMSFPNMEASSLKLRPIGYVGETQPKPQLLMLEDEANLSQLQLDQNLSQLGLNQLQEAASISFHGASSSTLEQYLSEHGPCVGFTFFRILDGNMAKHTVQGERLESSYDFLTQAYCGFSTDGTLPSEDSGDSVNGHLLVSPSGMPTIWDTSCISFKQLASDLQLWKVAGAEYKGLNLPHVSLELVRYLSVVIVEI